MLSFDITDKTIKVVRGSEKSGRITVTDAVTIDIEDNSIEDGKVTDINGLAAKIDSTLKMGKMKEKNAIVSISSNQTIFKEMTVPKAKGSQFLKIVKAEMRAQLGVDDSYCLSYIIIEEQKGEKNTKPMVKILATACPQDIVASCRQLFSRLSISLKSFMIGCNCITKMITSDMRLCMKMPLLAIQIDRSFLNINLYDDLNLAFSRFTTIDPADYGFEGDYIGQAVNENIFRMLQFQKTRKSDLPIEHVVFYGDLENVDDILAGMEQLEINADVLNAPNQVNLHGNIDFSTYANAIGALFKVNKDKEKINLLETNAKKSGKAGSASGGGGGGAGSSTAVGALVALLGATVVAVGGVWYFFDTKYNSLDDQLTELQTKIDMAQSQKKLFDELTVQEEKINQYRNGISIAADAFKTHPPISYDYFLLIETEMVNAANELGLWAEITSFSYGGYSISLGIRTAADSDPTQRLPALIVEKLLTHTEFSDVMYSGWGLSEDSGIKIVNYNIQIPLSPIEPTTAPETTEADGQPSETTETEAVTEAEAQ